MVSEQAVKEGEAMRAAAVVEQTSQVGAAPSKERPDPPQDSSDLWSDAYRKVESYFVALRIRNKLLLSRLVFRVLEEASRIYNSGDAEGKSPTQLAAEEADRVVDAWLQEVLDETGNATTTALHLSARGRLALLLADMPERWQAYFLTDAPWPEEFTRTMRQSYLRAGPDFQIAQMEPREIDLGPVGRAARTLENLGRYPRVKFAVLGALSLLGLWALVSYVG